MLKTSKKGAHKKLSFFVKIGKSDFGDPGDPKKSGNRKNRKKPGFSEKPGVYSGFWGPGTPFPSL